jgi:hypothetical protein
MKKPREKTNAATVIRTGKVFYTSGRQVQLEAPEQRTYRCIADQETGLRVPDWLAGRAEACSRERCTFPTAPSPALAQASAAR